MKLEEKRDKVVLAIQKRQETTKRHFDQTVTLKKIVKDQYVMLWNKAKEKLSMHTKFEALWIRPY